MTPLGRFWKGGHHPTHARNRRKHAVRNQVQCVTRCDEVAEDGGREWATARISMLKEGEREASTDLLVHGGQKVAQQNLHFVSQCRESICLVRMPQVASVGPLSLG